ncbi:MAG TPA: plastocyanin/azurin family copper-binding protein, partial [Rubrobacter sp.]|nr:plastocyanin/azurin family copper-binding protein [Rubrobacter sp.]
EIDGEGVKSKGGEVGKANLEPYLDSGQSGVLTLTFQKPGTYEMYCPVIGHRLAGMKGSVVVK